MRPVSFGILVLLSFASCSPGTKGKSSLPKTRRTQAIREVVAEGEVVGITDGDTIRVMMDGQPVRVRLSGIDAPEKAQPFGQAAKNALSDAVFGKRVRLGIHGQDRYGRRLADVFAGGDWINLRMVREGFAWRYTAYTHDQRLIEAEVTARVGHFGLWTDPSPVPPWEWRKK